MKVLNLYAGIGGNRKLWKNAEVTAVEFDPEIAAIYQELFPNDQVIIGDAHSYLLQHYKEYDFIWSSPPCPSHSDIRRCGVHKGQYEALFPDMKLYEEIILLQHFAKCKWVIENVRSYYDPLIRPYMLERHYFWSNFHISNIKLNDERIHNNIAGNKSVYGFNLSKYKIANKRQIFRNCVNPRLGLHIFNCAAKERQIKLTELNRSDKI